MKFSKQWLAEWLELPTAQVLIEQLTMAGLEVDALEPAAPEYSGVIVGEIVDAQQHPDADKLRVCSVKSAEDEIVQVVCGAANAHIGLKAPFAQLGACLPDGFKIKKARLRGVDSYGMLCAASELGLTGQSAGLLELPQDAPVGEDFRRYLQLNDACITLDLTPNRGDCLSILGLAREVAVLNDVPCKILQVADVVAASKDKITVHLEAPEDCPRYVSRIVKKVDLSRPSPLWLQEKLRRSNINSVNAVVDISNFVMLELGQPMHAFDLAVIEHDIHVRHALPGEHLTLLNGQQLELKNSELVIADNKQLLALAGIMGGTASAVHSGTRDILLEAAFFTPQHIAGRARSLGLHTDASHRFERGVDYQLPALAIERATGLLLAIVGGEAGETQVSESAVHLPQSRTIVLRASKIASVLGLQLDRQQIEHILSGLGFALKVHATEPSIIWDVTVPSWRFDIGIEVDLLEELARIYGYSRLPVSTLSMHAELAALHEKVRQPAVIEQTLLQRGYQEVVCYSFIAPELQQQINPGLKPVAVKNPISSDMAVMRSSLWPGLLQTLDYNNKRQQLRVRIFEQGLCFIPHASGLEQRPYIAGLISGSRAPENWTQKIEMVDFYDIKSDVEQLLVGGEYQFKIASHPALHPGQSAQIVNANNSIVGYVGALHPGLHKKWGFAVPVMLFELDYQQIKHQALPVFRPISRFPEVRRDLALLIDREQPVDNILSSIKKHAGTFLKDLILFDNYQGKGIDIAKKSIAIGLIFCKSDTTLTDEEVNLSINNIKRFLKDEYGAVLRD